MHEKIASRIIAFENASPWNYVYTRVDSLTLSFHNLIKLLY